MTTTWATALPAEVSATMASRGFTVRALAAATGIPRTTLSRRLSGETPFLMNELQAVCEALDTKISDLVEEIEVSA